MGNRAVLSLGHYHDDAIGIYLHWNGGRDSIEGFLLATREVMAERLGDESYGAARLVQCIATFINGNLSLGLSKCKNLDCDNMDNGLYEIDLATMTISGRRFQPKEEQAEYDPRVIADIILKKLPPLSSS